MHKTNYKELVKIIDNLKYELDSYNNYLSNYNVELYLDEIEIINNNISDLLTLLFAFIDGLI